MRSRVKRLTSFHFIMSLVSVVRRNGRSAVVLSEYRSPADSVDCIDCNWYNDPLGGASEHCGHIRSDKLGELRGSFHPVHSGEHSPRSHIYYNEAEFPEYRSRRDKAYNICSRYTEWSDTASSSRRCRTRNGFLLLLMAAMGSRSVGCLAGAPCKSYHSER